MLNKEQIDLLNPSLVAKDNYIHQLDQTIKAYSKVLIVVGEALQNALDAVCDLPLGLNKGEINLTLDLDNNRVVVRDNGKGFPKDLSLLYLGGTRKSRKKLKGNVGVGIKVTLFSSEEFRLKSNLGEETWEIEIRDAYKFSTLSKLPIPSLPDNGKNPLISQGTEISYTFPINNNKSLIDEFIQEIVTECLNENNFNAGFGGIINNEQHVSPLASLLLSYLRRNSYVGDVLANFGRQENFPTEGISILFEIVCSNPEKKFSANIAQLFNGKKRQEFYLEPRYLTVDETVKWVPKGRKGPKIFNDKLGPGGLSLVKTDGFNTLWLCAQEEFESLLRNKDGNLPQSITKYREKLFPKINGIYIGIGRIPEFNKFLPTGSRRILSCNGIVTNHDIDFTSGQNQEYVRCIDLIIDLDAELNYGKSHITNAHLVKLVKDYINESYSRVLQKATGQFVGKMPKGPDDENEEIFTGRPDLGVDNLILTKEPQDENDVIALFFALSGKGLFSEYKVFGLSQKARYDGKAVIVRPYDEASKDLVLNPSDDTKLRNIEFKVHATELIRDFDRSQKYSLEIPLVIAWDLGNYVSSQYGIYDIEDSKAYESSPPKTFPFVTKYIYDTRGFTEVQVLLLSEVINQLKEGVLEFPL